MLFVVDLVVVGRRPRIPGTAQCRRWLGVHAVIGVLVYSRCGRSTSASTARSSSPPRSPSKLPTAGETDDDAEHRNAMVRRVSQALPTRRGFDGTSLRTVLEGRRPWTPTAVVLISLGTTDLLVALDSIPAILGLTDEPDLVGAANVVAVRRARVDARRCGSAGPGSAPGGRTDARGVTGQAFSRASHPGPGRAVAPSGGAGRGRSAGP